MRLHVPSELKVLREHSDGYFFEGNEALKPAVQQYYAAIEPYSFHCNLTGIGLLRSTMGRLGMLAEGDPSPFPTSPQRSAGQYLSETAHRLANPGVWTEYQAAESAAMRQRGNGPGMARFKFLSNGPWIVLAEEVSQALHSYDAVAGIERQQAETNQLWVDWIGWLRTAASGFEVS